MKSIEERLAQDLELKLDFLSDIVSIADMPVYAIGGISFDNLDEVLKTGAKGACMMSSLMREKRS